MNWLGQLMTRLRRPVPLLPPELAWRIEIVCSHEGTLHVLTSNYDGVVPEPAIYATCTAALVDAARKAGLGPDVLLGGLAQQFLRQTTSHISGKKLIVAR